ncbi:hypothetical protein SsS58_07139 [Streptomyces scabiei]|uniref:Uncharacterized protein n=1 Tax=Streptomyces scabiei TaxID=1930 RepID=A0A100JVZ5_STRSC|nr:hypothetical protein SsS58_07139 [Streptomyces scabiei]
MTSANSRSWLPSPTATERFAAPARLLKVPESLSVRPCLSRTHLLSASVAAESGT